MLICTCILETQQWMELHLQSLIFTKRISRIWIFDLWSILCLWFHAFLSDPEIENRNGFIEYFYAAKFMIFSLCDVTDKKQVVTNIDVSKNMMKASSRWNFQTKILLSTLSRLNVRFDFHARDNSEMDFIILVPGKVPWFIRLKIPITDHHVSISKEEIDTLRW